MSSFKNYFNEEVNLEEDWPVAISETIFPSKLKQVNNNNLMIFSSEGLKFHEKNLKFDAITRPYGGERRMIEISSYENLDHRLRSMKTPSELPHFDYQYNKINGNLFLFFVENGGNTFPSIEISSILDFNGIHDGYCYDIGYKMLDTFENLTMA